MKKFNLSVLDLVPIEAGSSSREALARMIELARLAEELGYVRYWLAEHHGMPNIASSSPEILIARVAAATERIRVGAGGIMLPNHAPLRIAEAFHTLEALFPGRIDLGVGRAPGTDPVTSAALRPFDAAQFPSQLKELLALSRREFPPGHPFHGVRVVPSDVDLPPVWVLGSSGATASLAGSLGLGYGFASHFSFTPPGPAIDAYRKAFRPSTRFPEPHVIVGAAVICAPTDEEADYLAKAMDVTWVRLRKGELDRLPTPEEAARYQFTAEELEIVRQYRSLTIWGSPATVARRIERLAEETGANEIMVSSMVPGRDARLRSYRLVMESFSG
ncbi:MAG: LLM class flavin-dependent oxidoreductase [Firmicutes bacterium]|nr:LLM class flavin-dependent oxidoreductase [Bacillota bacterium]